MALHEFTSEKSKRQKKVDIYRKASFKERKKEKPKIEKAMHTQRKQDCPVEMDKMMMISRRSSLENLRIESISNDPITIPTTNCPTWKLYENPLYTNTPNKQHQPQKQITHPKQYQQSRQLENKSSTDQLKQIHRLQLPISTRKIAASFWDLTFIRPFMESELDMARAKIAELKIKLEQECKASKKAQSMNKKLAKELSEVKKGREALDQLCEKLAKEVSSDKVEMNRMHKDMEGERRMLRMAEVLREERVQMKLADAKLLLEEKLSELEASKTGQMLPQIDQSKAEPKITQEAQENCNSSANANNISCDSSEEEIKSCVLVEKSAATIISSDRTGDSNPAALVASQRKALLEPENRHIKRGIKGFVEFPKVVRAICSKSRYLAAKLECQKDQHTILLKQKTPIRSNTLLTS